MRNTTVVLRLRLPSGDTHNEYVVCALTLIDTLVLERKHASTKRGLFYEGYLCFFHNCSNNIAEVLIGQWWPGG